MIRQSARLAERLLQYYRSGTTWSYCEMTAPSLAHKLGWEVQDYKRLVPHSFGPFNWNVRITPEQWKTYVRDDHNTDGRFYHRLKF